MRRMSIVAVLTAILHLATRAAVAIAAPPSTTPVTAR